MENKQKNNNDSNVFSEEALLEAEELISRSKYDNQPASSDFRESLKTKILEKRQQKKFMKNPFKNFGKFITVKRIAPVLAGLVIVALIITTAHFWPTTGPFKGFSKLIINPAYAQDNFTVEAMDSDSIGIESDTSFIITSKQEITDVDLLRENILLEPSVNFKLNKIDNYNFEIVPDKDLDSKKVYNIIINASFISDTGVQMVRNYSWAFQVKDTFKVVHTLPRDKGVKVPLNSGIEITFSHDNFENYNDKITFEPQIKGKFEQHKRTLVFVPESLTAATIYKVTVDKSLGLKDSDKTLMEDFVFEFETDPVGTTREMYKGFNFAKQTATFSTQQVPAFQFNNYNLTQSEYELKVYKLNGEDQYVKAMQSRDYLPYWSYNRLVTNVDVSGLTEMIDVSVEPQQSGYANYLVLPEELNEGYYVVQTTVGDFTRQVLFQVTDLTVYLSITDTEGIVWVHDIETGQIAKKASVEIIGTSFKGKLDNEGILVFDTDLIDIDYDSRDEKTYYLKISYDNDVTILPLDSYRKSYIVSNQQYWDYVYTDRTMYKPNDVINVWGFVKNRDGEKVSDKVVAKINNGSYYNYFYEQVNIIETEMDVNNGAFSGQMELDNLTPGYYTIGYYENDVLFASSYFRVFEYVKPAYQVQIQAEKDVVFAGDQVNLTYSASFFEGTPLNNLKLNYKLGKEEKSNFTDDLGQINDSYIYPYDCKSGSYSCSYPKTQYFNVRVDSPEESDIYEEIPVKIFGAKVDGRVESEVNEDDKTQANIVVSSYDVDISKVDAGKYYQNYQGQLKSGSNVKVKVIERYYEAIENGEYYDFINKIVHKKYRYNKVENTFLETQGVTNENGQFEFLLQGMNPERYYIIYAEVYDDDGRFDATSTSVSKYRYYYNQYNNDYYDLKLIKQVENGAPTYNIGENVEVALMKNGEELGVANKAFLYYKMQRGLLDYDIESHSRFNFDFDKNYIPNIYMKGVYFDGQTYHENGDDWWYSRGGKLIRYNYEESDLNFEVNTEKNMYKPGEKAKVKVKVTDVNGNAVKANVNLNLVDEAFYKIAYDNANALENLYETVDSGLRKTETSHEEAKFSSGAEGGGCFTGDTLVKMADGSEKQIKDIQIGDEVLTFVNSFSNEMVAAKVLDTDYHIVSGYYIINDNLKVTPEHMVFVNNSWMMIGEAKIGDWLKDANGNYFQIKTIDILSEVVEVYNLHIDKYHTYIANGVYVHNDKGGGGRDDFRDTALFFSAQTNNSGEVEVEFEVPDNITSWRITAQAITDDLKAGVGRGNFDVSLPVFVLPTMAKEYLVSDKPFIAARAYGRDLQSKESVLYTFESDDLGVEKQEQEGQSFVASYFDVGNLTAGEHNVEIGVSYKDSYDSVIQSINVIDSRVTEKKQNFYKLESDITFSGEEDGNVKLSFNDRNQGRYYWLLRRLNWGYGDRLDQVLGRVVADDLLYEYFGEEMNATEKNNLDYYQLANGSISLLPYSDGELAMTAKTYAVASDYFDQSSAINYFYSILNSRDSNKDEIAIALYGLAALDEPVLLQIKNFAKIENLSYREKIYTALAACEIGDKELARSIYLSLMQEYGEELNSQVRIKVGGDNDDILEATALMAIVAAGINDVNHERLFNYVESYYGKDILTNLEKLLYLDNAMPYLIPGNSKFVLELDGKKIEKELKQGQSYSMIIQSEKLDTLKVLDVEGEVGLMTEYQSADDDIYSNVNNDIKIRREYKVDGKITNTFEKDDIIEVWLYPEFTDNALKGYYQLTDYLPSGLSPVTKLVNSSSSYKCTYRYPYNVSGQVVKFGLWNGSSDYKNCGAFGFMYYARVTTPGKYTAEPVIMQSQMSPSVKNYSQYQTVNIEK